MGALAARMCEDRFSVARDELESIIEFLKSGEADKLSHSALENLVTERGREMLRTLLQAHLDARGPGEAAGAVRGADGIEREQARLQERGLSSVFGEVRVRRLGYGAEGTDSLQPLDAELNLPVEQYSFGLRRLAAQEAARGSFDEAQSSVAAQTGTTVPKRQLEQLVARAATDFDDYYAQRAPPAVEDSTSVLVITADAKGVVMLPADLREATRKAAAQTSHKLQQRLSKGEKRNVKRMATVAAVYTIAPFVRTPEEVMKVMAPRREAEQAARPRPQDKRVWASLQKQPEEVLEEAFVEARRRDPGQVLKWVALVDGNESQLRILKKLARRHAVRLAIVLDVIHVCEYLWGASLCFHAESDPAREEWVADRLLRVLRGEASLVAAGIRRSATRRRLRRKARAAADRCCNYLLKHSPQLRYDKYLRAGLPIATGVIEGACRHLIKDRMDVTGARWRLRGAEAVLRLRALRSSGDFENYWRYHEQREYQRNHADRYAQGAVVPVRGRHISRVK